MIKREHEWGLAHKRIYDWKGPDTIHLVNLRLGHQRGHKEDNEDIIKSIRYKAKPQICLKCLKDRIEKELKTRHEPAKPAKKLRRKGIKGAKGVLKTYAETTHKGLKGFDASHLVNL